MAFYFELIHPSKLMPADFNSTVCWYILFGRRALKKQEVASQKLIFFPSDNFEAEWLNIVHYLEKRKNIERNNKRDIHLHK